MNDFNLVDNPWMPVAGRGKASLRDVFTDFSLEALGGNSRQKIAVFRLLLAIAQRAATPEDDEAWRAQDARALSAKCAAYLALWRESFNLYGEKPFLQMPVAKAELFPLAVADPELASGNNPVYRDSQTRAFDDAEKALWLVCAVAASFGGKKGDKKFRLSETAERDTPKPSPAMDGLGPLHSWIAGDSIIETVRLNLLTEEDVASLSVFSKGVGVPPWERMPQSENCPVAESLAASYAGRLVGLCRFCLFEGGGVHYADGIRHPLSGLGVYDPTTAVFYDRKKPRLLYANPEQGAWRELPAMLAFMSSQDRKNAAVCRQLEMGLRKIDRDWFWIRCAGARVSNTSGEQFVGSGDGYVFSEYRLNSRWLGDEIWYLKLSETMLWLDGLSRKLYACVSGYFNEFELNEPRKAARACGCFWRASEALFQDLLEACGNPERLPELKNRFASFALDAYGQACPSRTKRELEAFARHAPRLKFESEARPEKRVETKIEPVKKKKPAREEVKGWLKLL